MWDVVTVGAGPAGAAAALAARRADPAARVLMLDSRTFPRDKVCGDGIAPQALDVLAGLGVDTAALVDGSAAISRLRLRSPGGAEAARRLSRPAYVVPRAVLDHRLVLAAVAAGAVLKQVAVRSVVAEGDAVLVNGRIRARTVIGADGAESIVRKQIVGSHPRPGTVALALRGYACADAWPGGEQLLIMTKSNWPAYAWVFPIGDGRANVGYGELLSGPPPTRAHLTRRLRDLLPGVEPTSLRGHRLPLSTGRPGLAHGAILLAGDAASLINPLTGEGIFYAVLSGSLAGAAAVGPDPAGAYRLAMRAGLGRHLRHTDAIARLSRWPVLLDAGIAAARDSPRRFDDMVEIGLGDGLVTARSASAVAWAALRAAASPAARSGWSRR